MKKQPKDAPAAADPRPKRKGFVLDQLKARKKDAPKPPGATPPSLPTKPAAPPKALSPADLAAAAQAATALPPPPPRPAQPPPPPIPAPPGDESDKDILEILFARAMRNRTDTKPADKPGVAMLNAVMHQFQHGQPLKAIEDIVIQHLGEMASKIHLVRNVTAYHDMERRALYAHVCSVLEDSLWDDLINQKLTPSEKLALLQLAIRENDKIDGRLGNFGHDLEKSGKGTGQDIETAVEKPDRILHKVEDPNAKELEGTSPIGRELARRLMEKAGKSSEKIVQEALKGQTPA